MLKLHLDTDLGGDIDDLCALAMVLECPDVEIDDIPLRSEIEDDWLCQRIDDNGKPTRVVTRADTGKFNEFWLNTVVDRNRLRR